MTDEIKEKLLELNFIQTIYNSANDVLHGSRDRLNKNKYDLNAQGDFNKAQETIGELTTIARELQEDCMRHIKSKYDVKLKQR